MKVRHQILAKAAVSAVLSCVTSIILLSCISAGLSSFLVGFDEDFYMGLYYDLHNATTMAVQESDEILVFDIGSYNSRTEVAEVLKAIAGCKPAAVGLDVFMAENEELKEEADSAVIAAITSFECPLVSPCVYDDIDGVWKFPFYEPFVDSTRCFFASPVAFDMLEQFSAMDPRSSKVTFAYELAEVFAGLSGRQIGYSNHFAANYRNKEFFPMASIDELDPGLVAGKLVLVGDCQDFRDIRSIPFKIMSSNNLPGVVNLAYTINSLLCTRSYCRENGFGSLRTRYNAPYRRCGTLMNLLLSYLLCFAFSFCMYFLFFVSSRKNGRRQRLFIILLPLLLTIVVETLLIVVCLEVFTSLLMLIPDIFLFVTSILFVSTSNGLVDEIASWKNK